MNCPRCKSSNHKKNGIVDGRQRYKCHDCEYNYSVEIKSTASSTSVKRQALQLYLEGLGFRSIGRFLGVSHVSVQKWIKKFGQELEDLKSENEISIVELDEMHTYIGNKKNIAGSGLLLIELGKSSSTALLVVEERKLDNNSGKNWRRKRLKK
jgi:transposase